MIHTEEELAMRQIPDEILPTTEIKSFPSEIRLLKPGKESSEFEAIKWVMIVGVAIIIIDKITGGMAPNHVKDLVATIRNVNFEEYIGAFMTFGGAVFWLVKRGVLKYYEIRRLSIIEIERIKAEIRAEAAKGDTLGDRERVE